MTITPYFQTAPDLAGLLKITESCRQPEQRRHINAAKNKTFGSRP
jgi:hypothetical protein